MENRQRQMAEFADLLEKYALQDGINPTRVEDVSIIRHSTCNQYVPEVYDPCMIIGAQGKKQIYVETTPYDYRAGNLLTVVLPVPATCAVVEATPDKPLLAMLIWFDLNRLMTVLSRLDMIDPVSAKPNADQSSGIFSTAIEAKLLDAVIRLLKLLDDPIEATMLSDALLDEIYFRILNDKQGEALKYHLRQRGQIWQISHAIEHIYQNLDKSVSVEELADIVNMSISGFHKKFKEVLHVSPLQYAKSIKLNRARDLILNGENASEAGYSVGYKSPAQFSREFKRHFGYSPSATCSN